jgi:hypothetical protein
MYNPIQDGIDKTVRSVRYSEAKPPGHLSGLVHCYWELKTESVLAEDFCLHAMPDACVNILFNQVVSLRRHTTVAWGLAGESARDCGSICRHTLRGKLAFGRHKQANRWVGVLC